MSGLKDSGAGENGVRARIPSELEEFFSQGGRSLVIRGAPGTGKTTLAMELLSRLGAGGKACFVSGRIDEHALIRHLRWIDFDMLLSKGKDPGFWLSKNQAISRKELDRLEARVEEGDGTLEGDSDPEPGSGEMTGDTWTIDINAVFPEMDRLYETLDADPPGKAIVAIDSVDSLAEKYGIAPKRIINTLQKDLVERSNVNVIFILETAAPSNLDFMGDGVVSLEMSDIMGRRIRSLRLEKLRGQPIWASEQVFSLAEGRFNTFAAGPGTGTAGNGLVDIETDTLLAGLTDPGTYTVFEIKPTVPSSVVRGLAGAVLREHGPGPVYTTPSIRLFGPGGAPGSRADIRIISPVTLLRRGADDPLTVQVDGESFAADFDRPAIDGLFGGGRQLFLMDANQILSHYGPGSLADLETHISHLLRAGGTCVGFSWPENNPSNMDLGMGDRLIRVSSRCGNIIFFGVKPHTPVFALAPGNGTAHALRPVL